MNKGTGYLPAGSDSAFFITHKPSSWVNPSPLWEVSLLLALLTLHGIKPESYISVFSYIYITSFFLIRCEWYCYCRTELQSMNFFPPSFSKNCDLRYALDNEWWVYYLYFHNTKCPIPLFLPSLAIFLYLFSKTMFVLCSVCTFNRLELE